MGGVSRPSRIVSLAKHALTVKMQILKSILLMLIFIKVVLIITLVMSVLLYGRRKAPIVHRFACETCTNRKNANTKINITDVNILLKLF